MKVHSDAWFRLREVAGIGSRIGSRIKRISDKRTAILEAALTLFAKRGYHGVSVALIAARAQVGAGTIYRYFRDKEVLVNALYRKHKREMSEAILSGLEQDLPPLPDHQGRRFGHTDGHRRRGLYWTEKVLLGRRTRTHGRQRGLGRGDLLGSHPALSFFWLRQFWRNNV
ncbi:MAG: helix-turn-helix domain-containing protein [Pseudomonadota bacterium]